MSGEFTINPQELSQAMMAMQQQPSMRVPSFQGSAPQAPISQAQSYGNEGPSLFKCIAVPAIAGGGATALGAYFFTDPKFLDASNKVKDEFIHLFQNTASIQEKALKNARTAYTKKVRDILHLNSTEGITAESISGVIDDLRNGKFATKEGLSKTVGEFVSNKSYLNSYFDDLVKFSPNANINGKIGRINKIRKAFGLEKLENINEQNLQNVISETKKSVINNPKFQESFSRHIAGKLEKAEGYAEAVAKKFLKDSDIATQAARLTKLNAQKTFLESIKDGTTAEQLAERLHEWNPNLKLDGDKAKKFAQRLLNNKAKVLNNINSRITSTDSILTQLKNTAQEAAKKGLKDGKPTANAAQCVKTAFSKIKWQQVGKIAGIAAAIAAIAGVTYYLLKPKQQPPSPFVQAHQA